MHFIFAFMLCVFSYIYGVVEKFRAPVRTIFETGFNIQCFKKLNSL